MIIIGFFYSSPLFSSTETAISFVYYSPKAHKWTPKNQNNVSFTKSTDHFTIFATTRSYARKFAR